jgi:hypothetical protein
MHSCKSKNKDDYQALVLGMPSISTILISLFSFSHHYMFQPRVVFKSYYAYNAIVGVIAFNISPEDGL